uniref:PPM-type phosphatase domain-containing protein n=1 Tax=Bionectria ochroleuca TaxID=29856 RepID=A0A8H7NF64_BIOOC
MMDNCLASNSETGGVGCDNMTMIIIGFLNGKTKDEWYDEIAKRVANGDGPAAPPEYAEFRGPGVHHNYEDSDSGYEMDAENKGKSFGVDDTGMFDNADEDKDLESQVSKSSASSEAPKPEPSTAERIITASTTKEDETKDDAKTKEETTTEQSKKD